MHARTAKRPHANTGSRFLLFKGVAFILAAATVWVLLNIDNLQEFLDTYYKRNQEMEQVELLRQRIRTLKKEQQSLKSNGIAREREVRERLGMHYPGEKVIFLQPEMKTKATSMTATVLSAPDANAEPVEGEEKAPAISKRKAASSSLESSDEEREDMPEVLSSRPRSSSTRNSSAEDQERSMPTRSVESANPRKPASLYDVQPNLGARSGNR